MENIETPAKDRYGLPKIGFVANLKGGVYMKELQELLSDTEHEPTSQEIRERADTAKILFLNKNGYETDARKKAVTESTAIYKAFDTGYDLEGQPISGWFEKNENGRFDGVTWGTMQQLRAYAQLKNKMSYLFKMGDFYFENIDECQTFLEDIAQATIPESWKYRNKTTVIKHPILKSYLETVFVRLKKENKVLKSSDGKYIIFNTNLLNKFFQEMKMKCQVCANHCAEGFKYTNHSI